MIDAGGARPDDRVSQRDTSCEPPTRRFASHVDV